MKPIFVAALAALACFVSSCRNQSDGIEKLTNSPNDTQSIRGLSGDDVKLVKTADLRIKVTNVEQGTQAVSALVRAEGGMVYYQNFHALQGGEKELEISDDSLQVITTYTPQAEMTVRVPSEHLETFLVKASGLGYFTESAQLKIDDKSLAYLENALLQKNRENVLHRSSKQKVDSFISAQTILTGDEAIQKMIANKTIDADVAYSNVTLSLWQNALVKREMRANDRMDNYNLPFSTRLGNALANGWDGFLNFLLAISHLWMFILVALLGYVGYRIWQQGRKPVV